MRRLNVEGVAAGGVPSDVWRGGRLLRAPLAAPAQRPPAPPALKGETPGRRRHLRPQRASHRLRAGGGGGDAGRGRRALRVFRVQPVSAGLSRGVFAGRVDDAAA